MKKGLFCAVIFLALLLVACTGPEQTPENPGPETETVTEAPKTVTPVPKTEAPSSASPQPEEQLVTEEPAATPEPTPTPVPVTDEQLDAGYLDGWFADSVLVGDSLVAGLSGYVEQERTAGRPCLGEMPLVSASALTLKKSMECEQKLRGAELRLRGYYMTISQVVSTLQAKKLFIMLGVSDPRWYTPEELVEAYDTMIQVVKAEHPDLQIYIHSIMPMIKDYAKTVQLTSEQNREVNRYLKAYCEEKGYTYIELADLVRDAEGYLVYEYSAGDYRFHLNKLGKAIWVRCLREQAREEYNTGKWILEEGK